MIEVQQAPHVRRGWEGAVLKLMRSRDFTVTVTGREQVGDSFIRLHCTDGGMLAAEPPHPTMWIRMWFDSDGRGHQRGYTLVDPDPVAGTFDLEFALHEGVATRWAREVEPGTSIEVTVQGTGFTLGDPPPTRWEVVGDAASMPAVNSLLDALGDVPARIFLEWQHAAERDLPLRTSAGQEVVWVERTDAGAGLRDAVTAAWRSDDLAAATGSHVWIACDTATTRQLTATLRKDLGVDKARITALGYWKP